MPRPSSPVYAKASTNCPYLTLENPHHQRQFWNSVVVGVPGASPQDLACPAALPVAADPKISHSTQLDNHFANDTPSSRSPGCPDARQEMRAAAASISRTHSQCQRGARAPHIRSPWAAKPVIFIPGKMRGAAAPCATWWSQSGSNRRPQACKASALPTELGPQSQAAARNERRAQHWSWWAE